MNKNNKEVTFLVERPRARGYEARAVGHSIYTEAATWNELRAMVRCAVRCHWPEQKKPWRIRLYFLREKITVA
jgi:hypothetical protein